MSRQFQVPCYYNYKYHACCLYKSYLFVSKTVIQSLCVRCFDPDVCKMGEGLRAPKSRRINLYLRSGNSSSFLDL